MDFRTGKLQENLSDLEFENRLAKAKLEHGKYWKD